MLPFTYAVQASKMLQAMDGFVPTAKAWAGIDPALKIDRAS